MTKILCYMDESLHTINDRDKAGFAYHGLLCGESNAMNSLDKEITEIRQEVLHGKRLGKNKPTHELKWRFDDSVLGIDFSEDFALEAIRLSIEALSLRSKDNTVAFLSSCLRRDFFEQPFLDKLSESDFRILAMAPIIDAIEMHPIMRGPIGNEYPHPKIEAIDFIFDHSLEEFDIRLAALLYEDHCDRYPSKERLAAYLARFSDKSKNITLPEQDQPAFKVYSVDSKKSSLVQMADILTGFMGYLDNFSQVSANTVLSGYTQAGFDEKFNQFYDSLKKQDSYKARLVRTILDSIMEYTKPDIDDGIVIISASAFKDPLSQSIASMGYNTDFIEHVSGNPARDFPKFIEDSKQKIKRYRGFVNSLRRDLAKGTHGLKYPTVEPDFFD